MELKEFFKNNPKIAIGFSGGVDSAYLLYAAINCNADIQPYYIKTAFQPQFEFEDARKFCEKLKIQLKVIEYDILSEETVKSNPENRCYYCKKALFTLLKSRAKADGYEVIIDGTNASDDLDDRPGAKALEELGVISPLRMCNLTKREIRRLSKKAGLFTWNKPSYACLATRVPCKNTITEEVLHKIEKSEIILSDMGFSDFRVRVFNDAARLQVKKAQFIKAARSREQIRERLKPYFDVVLLDTMTR